MLQQDSEGYRLKSKELEDSVWMSEGARLAPPPNAEPYRVPTHQASPGKADPAEDHDPAVKPRWGSGSWDSAAPESAAERPAPGSEREHGEGGPAPTPPAPGLSAQTSPAQRPPPLPPSSAPGRGSLLARFLKRVRFPWTFGGRAGGGRADSGAPTPRLSSSLFEGMRVPVAEHPARARAAAAAVVCLSLAVASPILARVAAHRQAARSFEQGLALLEDSDPRALLLIARAVGEDPSSWTYRRAAAAQLMGRPNLVFLAALPGNFRSAAVDDQGIMMLVDSRGNGGRYDFATAKDLGQIPGEVRFASGGPHLTWIDARGRAHRGEGPVKAAGRLSRAWTGPSGTVGVGPDGTVYGSRRLFRARGQVASASADLKRLAFLQGDHVRLYRLPDGAPVGLLPAAARGKPVQASLSRDGRCVLVLEDSGRAALWSHQAGWTSTLLPGKHQAVAMVPDGGGITAGADGVTVWDPRSGAEQQALLCGVRVESIGVDGQGTRLVFLSRDGVRLAGAKLLTPPRAPLPDWDQPPDLLELEAWLYARGRLAKSGELEPIPPDELRALKVRWEREAARHARDCECRAANLWNFYRSR